MPGAWSAKRERDYEELKDEFKEEGRYQGREEEVAARIVNKQRAQYSETKEAKEKDREGRSPDEDLPIDNYDHLTVDQVKRKLDDLSEDEVEEIEDYEKAHKDRKTLIQSLDKQ